MPGQDKRKGTSTGKGFFNRAKNFVLWKPKMKDYNFNVVVNNNFAQISESERKVLKSLSKKSIPGVAHDSSERDPPPKCHPGTRLDICGQATSWFHDIQRREKIFWLHGPAGVGKSAIMQTLAESEVKSSILGATIFFSKLKGLNKTKLLFNTIAYQLAVRFPLYRDYIIRILTNDPQVVEKAMKDQFDLFIVHPFTQDELLKGYFGRVLIVLDGLDEADTIDAQRALISLIGHFATDYPTSPLIWAIASRPEPDIVQSFHDLRQSPPSYMEIQIEIDSDKSRADMELFLRSRFDEIRKRYSAPRDWPSEVDFLQVAKASSGHFIYGEVTTRFVDDDEAANPVSQLKLVIATIEAGPSMAELDSNPLANLDLLYTRILSTTPLQTRSVTTRLLALSFMDWPGDLFSSEFWLVSNWLQLTSEDTCAALRKLHSIIRVPVPDEVGSCIELTPFHKSFADFILSPTRSGDFHVANPLKLALTGAVRVLDESCDPVTSDIQVSRIKLHWAYKHKEGIDAVRRHCFTLSYWAVADYIPDALSCDDDAPIRLRAFFQSVDFADSSYIGNETISERFHYEESEPIFPLLESWGLAQPITIQSIRMGRVRIANAIDAWADFNAYEEPDVPSCFTEECTNPWGLPVSPLAEFPDWEDRLQSHLKAIENIVNPARVYLLGQGSKSGIGIYQKLSDENPSWYYIIPYDQL